MDAFRQRRIVDFDKLRALCRRSNGRIQIQSISEDTLESLTLVIQCRTAPSEKYPSETQQNNVVQIRLPARYPLEPPIVVMKTPVFHPNIWESGRICLGDYMPTSGLDQIVLRIVKIISFDRDTINERSPADKKALAWYKQAVAQHPHAFPSDTVSIDTLESARAKISFIKKT